MQKNKTRVLHIFLLGIFLFLQYKLWFAENGILTSHKLKVQLSIKTNENALMQKKNDDIVKQIETLKSDQAALESLARQELGMIKKQETFYQTME